MNYTEPSRLSSRLCTYCDQKKTHLLTDSRLKDGSRIYVDQEQRRWAGRRCPDCERYRVKETLRFTKDEKLEITQALSEEGYSLLGFHEPLTATKGDHKITVDVVRATLDNENLRFKNPPDLSRDLCVILFRSLRIVDPKQLPLQSS